MYDLLFIWLRNPFTQQQQYKHIGECGNIHDLYGKIGGNEKKGFHSITLHKDS